MKKRINYFLIRFLSFINYYVYFQNKNIHHIDISQHISISQYSSKHRGSTYLS